MSEYSVTDVPLGYAPVPPQLIMWRDREGKPLTGTEIRVWTMLALHRDLMTQKTSAGVLRMSKMLDVDRTTIQRAVNRLMKAGFLLHQPRRRDPETGEFRPATFTLAINKKPLRYGVVDHDAHHDASAHTTMMQTRTSHDAHHDAHHDASVHTKREYKEEERDTLSEGGQAPEKPAKALTTLTVERTEEVGFFASKEQKANWGRGWSSFVYVEEGRDPPDAERQFAVLSEIVAAAAGRLGKTRFFLSVRDAARRVDERRPGGRDRAQAPESRQRDRMEGYEFLVDDSEPPSPEELKERLERLRRAS
jgi:hypothetical protein